MTISLMTGYFYDTKLLSKIELIKKLGFRDIEIWGDKNHFDYLTNWEFINKKNIDYNALRYRKFCYTMRKIRKLNIHIQGIHIPSFGKYNPLKKNNRGFILEHAYAIIKILPPGTRLIIHPGENRIEKEKDFLNSIFILKHIARQAEKKKIYLAVENPLPHHYGGWILELDKIIYELRKEYNNIGICLDSSHANLSDGVINFIEYFRNKIIWTHLSDNNGRFDDHLVPGYGRINWQKILSKLKEFTNLKYLNIEIINPRNNIQILSDARNTLEKLWKSL